MEPIEFSLPLYLVIVIVGLIAIDLIRTFMHSIYDYFLYRQTKLQQDKNYLIKLQEKYKDES